ncbi:MAG: hypothetical protein HYV26_19575 [Candidatus Hydrogenedentes bacterium]|nr:hypothetical protein [Candidatus Hydrogenedentota bacterium]
MSLSGEDRFSRLEAAIAGWNAKVNGAYQELADTLAGTKRKLDLVLRILAARRTLSPTLVVARMKMDAVNQTPDQREAAAVSALARLNLLDQTLTSFHVELRTLQAQAGRALAAGDVLSEELLTMQDAKEAAMLAAEGDVPGLGEAAPAAGGRPEAPGAQAAALRAENQQLREQVKRLEAEVAPLRTREAVRGVRDAEVEALRAELAHVRGGLKQAQALAASAAQLPAETELQQTVQEVELEALRKELSHVREQFQVARSRAERSEAAVSEREHKLTGRIETLRRELLRVREQLASTEQRARQTVLTAEMQQELAEMRTQVEAVHSEGIEAERKPGEDTEAVFQRICRNAFDTTGNRRPLGKILVDAGVVNAEQLEAALREQQTAWNRHLGGILVELGFASEDAIAQTLAAQIRAPFVHLRDEVIQPEALALVSGSLAHHHSCLPLRVRNDHLVIAMTNPFDLLAFEDLQLAAGRGIEPVVAPADEIKAALRRYYPQFVRV